jgi:hypothetical protein
LPGGGGLPGGIDLPGDDIFDLPDGFGFEELVTFDLPGYELCDGVDNDGDLEIDEDRPDTDGDTISDAIDNCPETPNADQTDVDGNGLGDECQSPVVAGLTVSRLNDQILHLDWEATKNDVLGFTIYRQDETNGPFQRLGTSFPTVEANANLLGDFVPPTGSYRYIVRVVNLLGQETDESTAEWNVRDEVTFIRGDCDGDGIVSGSINDPITLLT